MMKEKSRSPPKLSNGRLLLILAYWQQHLIGAGRVKQ